MFSDIFINMLKKNNAVKANVAKNNITEGPIWKGLLSFFFPILLGTFFQQLYNTVDAVIVGRFVGKEALAAVGGSTGFYINLIVGFFVGLSSGCGVVISQFYGGKNSRETNRSVHTALTLGIISSVLITIIGLVTAKPILKFMDVPEEILGLALDYLNIFFAGIFSMVMYNTASGIIRASGDSRTPFVILVVACGTNIVFDILFVAGFNWGIKGAAFATILAQTISMILVLMVLHKSKDIIRFRMKDLCLSRHITKSIIRIGLPTGLQSVMYTVSNLIIQTNINGFGTNTIAASAAWGKIDALFWMTINAFGIAMTTFAGQNYGNKNYERIKKANLQCMIIATSTTIILSTIFYFWGGTLFKLFTEDEKVIEIGMSILRFICPTFFTYVSIEVVSGTMRGCGSSFVPTLFTLVGVCLLRLVWLFTVVPHFNSLQAIYVSYPMTWIVTSILFWIYYAKGDWLRLKKKNGYTEKTGA